MNCQTLQERLVSLIDSEPDSLAPAENPLARIAEDPSARQHLSTCRECADFLQSLQQLDDLAQALPEHPAPDMLLVRTLAAVREAGTRQPGEILAFPLRRDVEPAATERRPSEAAEIDMRHGWLWVAGLAAAALFIVLWSVDDQQRDHTLALRGPSKTPATVIAKVTAKRDPIGGFDRGESTPDKTRDRASNVRLAERQLQLEVPPEPKPEPELEPEPDTATWTGTTKKKPATRAPTYTDDLGAENTANHPYNQGIVDLVPAAGQEFQYRPTEGDGKPDFGPTTGSTTTPTTGSATTPTNGLNTQPEFWADGDKDIGNGSFSGATAAENQYIVASDQPDSNSNEVSVEGLSSGDIGGDYLTLDASGSFEDSGIDLDDAESVAPVAKIPPAKPVFKPSDQVLTQPVVDEPVEPSAGRNAVEDTAQPSIAKPEIGFLELDQRAGTEVGQSESRGKGEDGVQQRLDELNQQDRNGRDSQEGLKVDPASAVVAATPLDATVTVDGYNDGYKNGQVELSNQAGFPGTDEQLTLTLKDDRSGAKGREQLTESGGEERSRGFAFHGEQDRSKQKNGEMTARETRRWGKSGGAGKDFERVIEVQDEDDDDEKEDEEETEAELERMVEEKKRKEDKKSEIDKLAKEDGERRKAKRRKSGRKGKGKRPRPVSPALESGKHELTVTKGVPFGPEQGRTGEGMFAPRQVGLTAQARAMARARTLARALLDQRSLTTGVATQPPNGLWANTYVPGDPVLRLLHGRLASHGDDGTAVGLGLAELDRAARPYLQAFDLPSNAALGLSVRADRPATDGPARMLLQVGLRGTARRSGRRPGMNIAVVLDLHGADSPDTRADAQAGMPALLSALREAKQTGDRFSLIVAGRPGAMTLTPEQFRHGPLTVAMQGLFADDAGAAPVVAEPASPALTLEQALNRAKQAVARHDDQSGALGTSMILLITSATIAESTLQRVVSSAHQSAVDGIGTSVIGVGPGVDDSQLTRLAAAGQGSRRLLVRAADAQATIAAELSAAASVVARAVRVRVKLAPGVKLVGVVGSHRLDAEAARQVREAEKSIDRRIERARGITADREDDKDGVNIVIPSFLADDAHVILLDVIAPGPGPVADVSVRYKDLVFLQNGVGRGSFALARGQRSTTSAEASVFKNYIAHIISRELRRAGTLLADGSSGAAEAAMSELDALLRGLASELSHLRGDPEFARDRQLVGDYLRLLQNAQASGPSEVSSYVSDSLRYAGWRKLLRARDETATSAQ